MLVRPERDWSGLNKSANVSKKAHKHKDHPNSVKVRDGKRLVGDRSGGGTPGPIPNPEVKPASADGSMRATACESRSLPTSPFSSLLFLLACLFGVDRSPAVDPFLFVDPS